MTESRTSPKLHRPHTSSVWDVPQFQLLVFLALRMKINPAHIPYSLVETNIVEALEARTANALHPMIGHEEVLLPAHEQMLSIETVLQRERGVLLGGLGQRSPRGKTCPVLEIDLLAAVPRRVCRPEEVFGADDFAFEKGCQCRMVVGESYLARQSSVDHLLRKRITLYAQVSA